MKIDKALNESKKIPCEECNEEMKIKPNPGLADANEYVCPKCGKTKIIGWCVR